MIFTQEAERSCIWKKKSHFDPFAKRKYDYYDCQGDGQLQSYVEIHLTFKRDPRDILSAILCSPSSILETASFESEQETSGPQSDKNKLN